MNGHGSRFCGVDVGSSSVKLACVACPSSLSDADDCNVVFLRRIPHQGQPAAALAELVGQMVDSLGDEAAAWSATGSGHGLISLVEGVKHVEDVPAIVEGVRLLAPTSRSIVHMGSQTSCYITGIAEGEVPEFATNDGCASGTGSFFEDQMERLGLKMEDYSRLVANAENAPTLSGRCAVFAKTDIIHRQQEGWTTPDILKGLCNAAVKGFRAALMNGLPLQKPVALVGGTVLNRGVRESLSEILGLKEGELACSPELACAQALGAALLTPHIQGGAEGRPITASELLSLLQGAPAPAASGVLPPLADEGYVSGKGFAIEALPGSAEAPIEVALGIDVGSTSTDLVALDNQGRLVDALYTRTAGNPAKAVQSALADMGARLGGRVAVRRVGVTGSGRKRIGEMVGADVVKDEITAQAAAASLADPEVDTVFEIGGQDSKFIALRDGAVAQFQMNKICAAGTGAFLEEQASKLGIPLDEFGSIALKGLSPVDLGERCTVFIEEAVAQALSRGRSREDVAAGLCYSVVRNYLHKVVGSGPVGRNVVLQGGLGYNAGVVAAFKVLAGEKVAVSPWFAVSGAVGAAQLAWETEDGTPSAFRGFDSTIGVEDTSPRRDERSANREFFEKSRALFIQGYCPGKHADAKTVGVPRCLMLHKLFPMVNAFFDHLGYNVVISDPSSEETVALSQELANGEVCYPFKLVYGHMEQLARSGVDYLFMPSMHTVRHVESRVAHNYACPYMQAAPQLVAKALRLEQRGVQLLNPLLDMDFGQDALARAMLGVGEKLGHSPKESALALLAGGKAMREYTAGIEALGDELLFSLENSDRVIVVISRQYGISDPELNMGIPEALIERGQKVITPSHLHAHDLDVSSDHPGMYWPFGQHLISAAKIVASDPRLFAVYLTNHGCGPDTMMTHLMDAEMGGKPYLAIEMDEHFSSVGVITRIEAFLNAVDTWQAAHPLDEALLSRKAGELPKRKSTSRYSAHERKLTREKPVVFPSYGVFGELLGERLSGKGFDARPIDVNASVVAKAAPILKTKEYLSFSAVAGCAVMAREMAAGIPGGVQLLVASSVGSEADGQYDRVLSCEVGDGREGGVSLVSPQIERLPWLVDDPMEALVAALAADVCMAASIEKRDSVSQDLRRVLSAGSDASSVIEEICAAAEGVGALGLSHFRGCVGVAGEWPCVVSDEMCGGALSDLEQQGWTLARMPLSEYLWFLWSDCAAEDASPRALMTSKGFSDSGMLQPGPEEKMRVLSEMEKALSRVATALGPRSPFSEDRPLLFSEADAALGAFRGANARYRAAKLVELSKRCNAVVAVGSLYENAGLILKLSDLKLSCPCIHLAFEGGGDVAAKDKLASFLFYVERGSRG